MMYKKLFLRYRHMGVVQVISIIKAVAETVTIFHFL